jgi:hypothetical protein
MRATFQNSGTRAAALREAVAVCCQRAHLRRTIRIAAVVGVVLTAINEGDVLIEGKASTATAAKIAMNFLIPFIVSNLGLLAGGRGAQG